MDPKQFKLLFLIVLKYLRRNIKWGAVGFLFLLLLFFLQLKFNLFFRANSISLGFIGTYQEHDLPLEVVKLASEGLVKIDENGRAGPNLVSGWDTNNDATEFKFKLTDDLKWSDGTFAKSTDLEFPIANTEVSYPDGKSIQFKLKEPYSPLPSLLTRPIFKKGTLIGTGPYKVVKVEKSLIFITKLALKPLEPGLPEIFIRFYPNEKVAIAGFSLGEVQALLGISNFEAVSENFMVRQKKKTDYSKVVTILYNTKDPLLLNRSLRQSLSFQAPKIEGEVEANNPYPPFSWAYNAAAKKYLDNSGEAKAALERAKTSMPDDKLSGEIILTSTPNLEGIAERIASAWEALGYEIKIRVESGIPQNFQALLITQSIPQDPDQYFLWHTTQEKTNITKYDSKRVDKDLEDGRKIISEEERKEKYFDFQKTLLEDTPATFLYFPKYNIVYLKKVEQLLDKVLEEKF